jgi:hypothetical protein
MNPVRSDFHEFKDMWDIDFEKNHRMFAQEIAKNIVATVSNSLIETKDLSKDRTLYFPLDLNKNSQTKLEVIRLAKSYITLSPFKEWVRYASPSITEEARGYLYNKMDIVGHLVSQKCNKLFQQIATNQSHPNCQFKAAYLGSSKEIGQAAEGILPQERSVQIRSRATDSDEVENHQEPVIEDSDEVENHQEPVIEDSDEVENHQEPVIEEDDTTRRLCLMALSVAVLLAANMTLFFIPDEHPFLH